MKRLRKRDKGAWMLAALMLGGCGSTVQENHYFASFREVSPGVREPVQFFRVSVDGDTKMANSRFLSGYFDERAVSLFFNEMRSPANSRLFDEQVKLPGEPDTKLKPLSPDLQNGAFVLILSTNADSIANAIGSFAESQVVADGLTRIVNKDRYRAKAESDAKAGVQRIEARALVERLRSQTEAATKARSGDEATRRYLGALTAIAQGLGYAGPEFGSLGDAQTWFTLEQSRPGSTP